MFVDRFVIYSDTLFRFFPFSHVLNPLGNQHSLDSLCNHPYDECTKEQFMDYLGVGNPQTPFPIHIHLLTEDADNETYYNQSTFFVCSSTGHRVRKRIGLRLFGSFVRSRFDSNRKRISLLQDCLQACSPLPPDTPDAPFLIGKIDGWLFIALIAMVLLLATFLVTVIALPIIRKSTLNHGQATGEQSSDFSLILDCICSLGRRDADLSENNANTKTQSPSSNSCSNGRRSSTSFLSVKWKKLLISSSTGCLILQFGYFLCSTSILSPDHRHVGHRRSVVGFGQISSDDRSRSIVVGEEQHGASTKGFLRWTFQVNDLRLVHDAGYTFLV